METLNLALSGCAYPIHVGRGLFENTDLILPCLRQPKVAIVTNTTVGPLYLQRLAGALRHAGVEVAEVVLPDGEKYKNPQTLNSIFDVLLERRCERSTTLIALGGGVIGDMTGLLRPRATSAECLLFRCRQHCLRKWILPLAVKPQVLKG